MPNATSPVVGVSYVEVAVADVATQISRLVTEHGFTLVRPSSASADGTVMTHGATVLVLEGPSGDARPPGLAVRTTDIARLFTRALADGGRPVLEPTAHADGSHRATVSSPGNLRYPLVQPPPAAPIDPSWLPGIGSLTPARSATRARDPEPLPEWTQVAIPVGPGLLDAEMAFAETIFGFHAIAAVTTTIDDETVATRVLQAPSGRDFLVLADKTAADPGGIRKVPTATGELWEAFQRITTLRATVSNANGMPTTTTTLPDNLARAAEQAMSAAELLVDPDTYARLTTERGYVRPRTWVAVGTVYVGVEDSADS